MKVRLSDFSTTTAVHLIALFRRGASRDLRDRLDVRIALPRPVVFARERLDE
jgi:hypothetical protein